MAAETLGVGVIGVGQVGNHHLDSYAKMDDVAIVGVADINDAERGRVVETDDIGYETNRISTRPACRIWNSCDGCHCRSVM